MSGSVHIDRNILGSIIISSRNTSIQYINIVVVERYQVY